MDENKSNKNINSINYINFDKAEGYTINNITIKNVAQNFCNAKQLIINKSKDDNINNDAINNNVNNELESINKSQNIITLNYMNNSQCVSNVTPKNNKELKKNIIIEEDKKEITVKNISEINDNNNIIINNIKDNSETSPVFDPDVINKYSYVGDATKRKNKRHSTLKHRKTRAPIMILERMQSIRQKDSCLFKMFGCCFGKKEEL